MIKFIFISIFIILLTLIYLHQYMSFDNFNNSSKNIYPYNPNIDTPQSNYQKIINKIKSQQDYKSNLSVALAPTPTINCPNANNKKDCNKYGCNWFGNFCSSTYPIEF